MRKTLYHSASRIVRDPAQNISSPWQDFVPGFSCTESLTLAKERAVGHNRDGYVSVYVLDTVGLSVLDLSQGTVLRWVAVLLQHRILDLLGPLAAEAQDYLKAHYALDLSPYDIITGYPADGSYFSFAQDFLNNNISCEQLSRALQSGTLGQQIMLKSEAAIARLQFMGYEVVPHREWYQKRQQRDLAVRTQYRNLRRQKGDLFLLDILQQEVCHQ